MKNNISLGLVSFLSLGIVAGASAETALPDAGASDFASALFTPAQIEEMKKVVSDHIQKNPDLITAALDAGMEKKQKEAAAKMEKAVAENKARIFDNPLLPTAGNLKGSQSLVVFWDPNCGYCKRFSKELSAVLTKNKDVKVIFMDLPIMGENSMLVTKALLAAHAQGKYYPFQELVYQSSDKLTKKKLFKLAKSVGMDIKKFDADMKDKEIQAQVDKTLDLAKQIGVNGTPTLIVNETSVLPGFLAADELGKKLTIGKGGKGRTQ